MSAIEERIAKIQTERGRIWNEMNADLEEINKRSDSTMSEEERAKWERQSAALDQLEAEGKELAERYERQKVSEEVRTAQGQVFGLPEEKREHKDANAEIRSWIRGEKRMSATDFETGGESNAIYTNLRAVEREREAIRLGASPEEVRALAWDTGSVASAVPTLFDRTLYEILEQSIAAFRMPFRRISTDSGAPMDFPKTATLGAATQVAGQGTTLAGTDPTFGKVSLTPVKYGQLVKLASEVVTDTGVDIVSFVSGDIGRAVGRRVDEAVMTAVNSATLTGSAGTVATGGSLIGPTYEKLVDVEFAVNDSYRSSGAAGWLMNDKTAATIRKLRDGNGGTVGAPIWQPSLDGGISGIRTPAQLLGYPAYTDPNIASMASNAKIMYFGDWSSFYFRTVGEMMVERNDSVGFATDEVFFRGKWRAAAASADATALVLLKQSV